MPCGCKDPIPENVVHRTPRPNPREIEAFLNFVLKHGGAVPFYVIAHQVKVLTGKEPANIMEAISALKEAKSAQSDV